LKEDLGERLNIIPTKAQLLIDRFFSKEPVDSTLSELYDIHAGPEISGLYKKHEVGVLDVHLFEERIRELFVPFFGSRGIKVAGMELAGGIKNVSDDVMSLRRGSVVVLMGHPETKRFLPVFEQKRRTHSQYIDIERKEKAQVCLNKKKRMVYRTF